MGTPEFAVPPLRRLVEEGYNVVAVVTAPDKPAGRGQHLRQSAVKEYAVQAGLPVLQPVKLKDEEFTSQFRELKPDLGIVIAFRMLPEIIWSTPLLGTFNLHASLLPQYRGAAPINRAVMNGETQTGLTTFLLNAEIDKGAILARRTVPIGPEETAGELHDRLMEFGPELVVETIGLIASGEAKPLPQEEIDEGELKPAPKIFREDCRIDWTQPGKRIMDHIRGLSPYPGAWSAMTLASGEKLQVKIFSAYFKATATPTTPGTISTDEKEYIEATCTDGRIRLGDIQAEGKKRMSVTEFLRGFQHKPVGFEQ